MAALPPRSRLGPKGKAFSLERHLFDQGVAAIKAGTRSRCADQNAAAGRVRGNRLRLPVQDGQGAPEHPGRARQQGQPEHHNPGRWPLHEIRPDGPERDPDEVASTACEAGARTQVLKPASGQPAVDDGTSLEDVVPTGRTDASPARMRGTSRSNVLGGVTLTVIVGAFFIDARRSPRSSRTRDPRGMPIAIMASAHGDHRGDSFAAVYGLPAPTSSPFGSVHGAPVYLAILVACCRRCRWIVQRLLHGHREDPVLHCDALGSSTLIFGVTLLVGNTQNPATSSCRTNLPKKLDDFFATSAPQGRSTRVSRAGSVDDRPADHL